MKFLQLKRLLFFNDKPGEIVSTFDLTRIPQQYPEEYSVWLAPSDDLRLDYIDDSLQLAQLSKFEYVSKLNLFVHRFQ